LEFHYYHGGYGDGVMSMVAAASTAKVIERIERYKDDLSYSMKSEKLISNVRNSLGNA